MKYSLILSLLVVFLYNTGARGSSGCPVGPIVSVNGGGRLGNCVWEYVSLYFLSKLIPTPHKPYSQKFINDRVETLFDNVTFPVLESLPSGCREGMNFPKGNVKLKDLVPMSNISNKFANFRGNLFIAQCVTFIEPVVKYIDEIKKALPYKQDLVVKANDVLGDIKEKYVNKTGIQDFVFVGMHIRRTDYISFLPTMNYTSVGKNHYRKGIEFFKNKTSEIGVPVFVIATDDYVWATENFIGDDIFVTQGDIIKPEMDLVLLSMCNHSIVDYGTFGLWAAIYTEGEVVTVYLENSQEHIMLGKLKNWHFLDPETEQFV